jgi:hypothetical protein
MNVQRKRILSNLITTPKTTELMIAAFTSAASLSQFPNLAILEPLEEF